MELNKLNLTFLRKLNFWIIFIIILSFTIAYYIPASQRVNPVGPIIGGDTWAHLGAVKRISMDWQPWVDQYYGEGIARSYSWFWHIILAGLSIIFPLYSLAIWSPLFFWIITTTLVYFMIKEIFGRTSSILFILFYYVIIFDTSIVNPNPKNFLILSFISAFYLMYKTFTEEKIKWPIIGGITLGIIFWNYTMLGYFLLIPFAFVLFKLIFNYKNEINTIYLNLKKCLTILFFAILISIPYWLPIVLDYNAEHAKLAKELIVASGSQASYMVYGYPLFVTIKSLLSEAFTLSQHWYLIPFMILGYFILFQKRNEIKYQLLITAIIVTILGSFHDKITKFLFGWNGFQPFYFPTFLRFFCVIILILGFTAAFNYLLSFLKNNSEKVVAYTLIFLTLLATIAGFVNTKNYLTKDYSPWAEQSFHPHPAYFAEPAKWIEANTGLEDVLVAHPYYAYGIFGLTGRRIYAAMYGHFLSQWEDDNQRRKDVREIYETSNRTRTLELLKKHNSTYLIIDPYILDKNQWFEDDNWNYILNKKPYDYRERNLTKFMSNPNFKKVYEYKEKVNGKDTPIVTIFKIKYS